MDIKKELIIDDGIDIEDDYNIKCGEVIVSSNLNFILCCSICHLNYKNFTKFVEHVTYTHSFSDFDQNVNNLSEQSDDNDIDIINPIENFCETEIDDGKLHYTATDGNASYSIAEIEMEPPSASYIDENMDYNEYDDDDEDNDNKTDFKLNHLIDNNNDDIDNPLNTNTYSDNNNTVNLFLNPLTLNAQKIKTIPAVRGTKIITKRYQCKWCDKSYPYSSSLSKHNRKSHGNAEYYSCKQCNMKFTKEIQLMQHEQKKHTEIIKLFKCSQCLPTLGMAFKTKKELIDHGIRAHINTQKFKCNFCFSGFSFKKELMNHEQEAHIDQRPYQCQICSFAFKEKKHLIRHERKHTGEKPYTCDYCDEKFTRMDKKKAHHQKKHPIKIEINDNTIKNEIIYT